MVCTVYILRYAKFLFPIDGILSLFKCSWSIELQIVLIGMHGLHCLFFFPDEKFWSSQLELSACPNILDQLDWNLFCEALMTSVQCRFYFMMDNSLLRLLEFWTCSKILSQLDCRLCDYAYMVCTVGFISWL